MTRHEQQNKFQATFFTLCRSLTFGVAQAPPISCYCFKFGNILLLFQIDPFWPDPEYSGSRIYFVIFVIPILLCSKFRVAGAFVCVWIRLLLFSKIKVLFTES